MDKQANSHDRKAVFLNSEIKSILDEKRLLSEGIQRDHAEIFARIERLKECAINAYSSISRPGEEPLRDEDESLQMVIKFILALK